ncbi:type IV pilus biogenesis/stability protein PilW [Colwellia sp. MSW7]|uniref:Type IV pilus biogenesis/stability protein PilW n=1 Tax=Colwellia maritima TaxID=2912588 RepID=A0ABS9WY52_9GAMM|nr:type IV pilus biogenesis/stability protein PilW [Colwellia maritima]MCI2282904.1 type IV pilus biogenesis/stability protein PilW [Colwellia maritima]
MKQVQPIMDKYFITKRAIITAFAISPLFLSGCVTQNYENDNTPVVQNQSNRNDMAATRVSLGLGYLKMGNMSQAKQNLEKAKNFAPDMVQVYTAFAHYYETVGEDELTVESYEKALSIKSEDPDTLNNYGVYLCRKDKIEEAEKQFLKAIAVPTYSLVSKSYENLASCFLQVDNFSKAETYLNKAIMHSPSSASTLFQMVQLQYAIGNYKQAKLFEQRFAKVTRRFTPKSLALSYKVHKKLGQRGVAKNYGTMLVKMYPQSWESQQYLLNELELIEADNLAKRYQNSQETTTQSQPKKRIVKLSPKKQTKKTLEETSSVQVNVTENETNQISDETSQVETAQTVITQEKQTIVKLVKDAQDSTSSIQSPITSYTGADENVSVVNDMNDKGLDNLPKEAETLVDSTQIKEVTDTNHVDSKPTIVKLANTVQDADNSVEDSTTVQPEQEETILDESVNVAKEKNEEQFVQEQADEPLVELVEPKNFPDFHVVRPEILCIVFR